MASPSRKFDFNAPANREINAPLDEIGRTALHLSVEKGDINAVKKLLRFHADLNQPDKLGQVPLYTAIKARNLALVELLLDHGATFCVEDNARRTPLMWAIEQKCSIEFLEQLRMMGMQLDLENSAGRQAIHAAAAQNAVEAIKYLVRQGVNIDAADHEGKTALHVSVEVKAHEALKTLLLNRADPLVRTKQIKTPLHFAAEKDEVSVDILLEQPVVRETVNGFKEYSTGNTPLMTALYAGNKSIAEKLIDIGADITQEDNRGHNSLFIAAEKGNIELVKMLLQRGADVQKNKSSSLLFSLNHDRYEELLSILYTAGLDLNAKDADGYCALHRAATSRNRKMISALLNKGADPNVTDRQGYRPLDLLLDQYGYYSHSYSWGHSYSPQSDILALIKLFLEKKADPNLSPAANITDAPFHSAILHGYKDIVNLLLSYKADFNQRGRNAAAFTPFMEAVSGGQQEIARILYKAGANILEKDGYGRSPLHLVTPYGSKPFLEELLTLPGMLQHINTPDKQGMTPLHLAFKQGRVDCIQTFIRLKADIYAHDQKGMTPLHYAIVENREEALSVASTALNNRLNWDIANTNDGDTLLHTAVKNGRRSIVSKLLAGGADVTIVNKEGKTPLDIAVEKDQVEIVTLLMKAKHTQKRNSFSKPVPPKP